MRPVTFIELREWNELVRKTYGKVYDFQQQDGCKMRGTESFTIPENISDLELEDYENDTVPEIVNHEEMGVSFKAWLERDPATPLPNKLKSSIKDYSTELWWQRNFYPHLTMLVADLHKRGILKSGEYVINIDW